MWRLWAELSPGFPHFEFLHAYGLGVLCIGQHAAAPVRTLCELDAASVAQIRERFSLLGERWVLDHEQRRLNATLQNDLATGRTHVATLEAKFAELAAYAGTLERAVGQPPARTELRSALARTLVAEQQRDLAEARATRAAAAMALDEAHAAEHAMQLAGAHHEARVLRAELDAVIQSRSWMLTSRLRGASEFLRGSRRHPIGMRASIPPPPGPLLATPDEPLLLDVSSSPLAKEAADAAPAPPSSRHGRPRVLFAAGEPNTPGCIYRCVRNAEAAAAAGWDASWKPVEAVDAEDLRDTDLLVLWRVTWSAHIEGVIEHVQMFGGRVALDLDDLMIRPELARVEFIDAIRSINWSEAHVRAMFSSVMHVLHRVDFCVATTAELAHEMRRHQKPGYVLVNGFDESAWRRSRLAARARAATADDGLVRIGYAGGSRTHQRDFAAAADAIAAVLQARPQVRLVLFRHGPAQEGLIAPEEFPALAALADRIEWREMVALEELPDELARFDVNVVPLQTGNPFVEAKSELKFFEAAIAGAPTVASPTGPYARAIRDGQTGFLADDTATWQQALLRLIDDPALRRRVARDACADVLWRFGPQGRAEAMRQFLAQHRGGVRPADGRDLARAFAVGLAAARADAPRLPPTTPSETLFHQDRLGEAAVTVVIASYNYADFVQQALESVRLQTLPLLDLVIVDDASPDPATLEQILDWAHVHAGRFNRLVVLRHTANAGLGATRNTGFVWAETPYVLPLDADNRLRPDCAERLLAALHDDGAAYAYPRLQHFGADDRITGGRRYEPQQLVGGNYIDAMALVARWAWSAAGGYYVARAAMGWEDFSLWCRMAELGFWGCAVDEVLAEYRVHAGSMVNAITETADNKRAMVQYVETRHPWIDILARDPAARM